MISTPDLPLGWGTVTPSFLAPHVFLQKWTLLRAVLVEFKQGCSSFFASATQLTKHFFEVRGNFCIVEPVPFDVRRVQNVRCREERLVKFLPAQGKNCVCLCLFPIWKGSFEVVNVYLIVQHVRIAEGDV